MAHFAKVIDGIVVQVIVADQEYIDEIKDDTGEWIQTSYNTRFGVHYGPDGLPDDKEPLRKNYAGIGYTYDRVRDAFIPPKTYDSFLLDEETCNWIPPIKYPDDGGAYVWDEPSKNWKLIT